MEQLGTYKKVEPSSLVTGTAGRLMLLPMILLLGNLGLNGVYDDSNSNAASSLNDPSPSTSAMVHQRDPMLSLAAGHEMADQELDLLFPELERIMSPLPDEMDDVSNWPPSESSGYLARTYAESVQTPHDITYAGATGFADDAVHTSHGATGMPNGAFHQSFTGVDSVPVAVLMNNGVDQYSELTDSVNDAAIAAAGRSGQSDVNDGYSCYPNHESNSYLPYSNGGGYYASSSSASGASSSSSSSTSSSLACGHWLASVTGSTSVPHLYSSEPGTGCIRNSGEERMDTSGDSAVSSMSSSGRVSSSSEDFLETSSVDSPHSRDYNGHHSDYQHNYYYATRSGHGYSNGQHRQLDLPTVGLYNNHTYSVPRGAIGSSIVPSNEPCDLVNGDNLGHHESTSLGGATVNGGGIYSSPSSITGTHRPSTSSNGGQVINRTYTSLRAAAAASTRSRLTSETDADGSESIASDEDSQFNRDERRARALNIPIATSDIINLPIDEFNERLAKYDLTEAQLSLIRDIRRRGKNKVAAQNCRKRKMDQILGLQGEVDRLFAQKESLELQQAHLLSLRDLARDKYTKLYHFILESKQTLTNGHFTNENPPDDPHPNRSLIVTSHLPHPHINSSISTSSINGTSAPPLIATAAGASSGSSSNSHGNIKMELLD